MRVISVNVGTKQDINVRGQKIPTGIFKRPVHGHHYVDIKGLRGDVRIDARRFGERDHAVHAYPHEHYAHWENYLGREPLPLGLFGENITVTGLLETDVRVGDVFRIGSAILQVTQPRIPCRKLDARVASGFKRVFLESRRVGYYLRVLRPGHITAGGEIELLHTNSHSPTLDEFVRLSQFDYWDAEGLERLLEATDLSDRWRDLLRDKLARARNAKGWFGLRELEIIGRREESVTAASFLLRCARQRPLPGFFAGQDLTLSVRPTSSAPFHRRAAALSSDPADTSSYRITIDFGSPSSGHDDPVARVIRRLDPGDTIRATEPQGWFTLEASPTTVPCERMIFISEGIGIASMLPLLYCWSSYHSGTPASFLHTAPRGRFGLLESEAEAIRLANPELTISEEKRLELELTDSVLVFAAGHTDFITDVQDQCNARGLDHTRVRAKRISS